MDNTVLIAHDIRSTHNVGSLLRTAECLGVKTVYLTGYTPYPIIPDDTRLPHLARKLDAQIAKTSLGAEKILNIQIYSKIEECIKLLKDRDYQIIALEQNDKSVKLSEFTTPDKVAIIVGNERYGIDSKTLSLCDKIVEIPMKGHKESLNVVQATAIALYSISD